MAHANGIEICYDTFGDSSSPALLLEAGMGNQMIEWDAALCSALAARGFWVIRYDHRDVGKSSKVTQLTQPAAGPAASRTPYSFLDMVHDATGLLDWLGVDQAHVVGISMGGCLVQLMAIHHRDRLRTITLMQTFAKGADLPGPGLGGFPVKMPESTEKEAFLQEFVAWEQFISGARYRRDTAFLRAQGEALHARGLTIEGRVGHAAAMAVTPDWYAQLPGITTPTLVIHGDADPLVPVELGLATAKAIPCCELLVIEGWGHGFPAQSLWPQLIEAIATHASPNARRAAAP